MNALELRIWDVNHGDSLTFRTPIDKFVMIDCAKNPRTGFSPVVGTRNWIDKISPGVKLDYLIISHPHHDHISDIEALIKDLYPKVLLRPKNITRSLLEKTGETSNASTIYDDFQKAFTGDVKWDENPCNENYNGGVKIRSYSLVAADPSIGHANLNDYSFVTFLVCDEFCFAYGADLSSGGWDKLIDQEEKKNESEFLNLLTRTNFFEVSHHGREDGFCPRVFEYMKNLSIAIISDKEVGDTSITGKYRDFRHGFKVVNHNLSDLIDDRQVLTTRKDGRIKIIVDPNGNEKIKISCLKINI